MPSISKTPCLPSVEPRRSIKFLRDKTEVAHRPFVQKADVLVPDMDEEEEQPLKPDDIDVLTCSDDDFQECISYIKEATRRREELQPKKKGMMGYTKKQLAALYEQFVVYHSTLVQASGTLHGFLEQLERRIAKLRYDESLLQEYYRTLEETIERGDEDALHKNNFYHRWQRELRRAAPLHRYSDEREILEKRHMKLKDLLQEIETDMRDFAVNDMDDAALSREYRMGTTKGEKLEEVYEDAVTVGSSPEVRLRMRALRPLLQRVRELRILPVLPPSAVHSRLQKKLILPFSARVLALKMDDGNSTGDRFVEWYVSAVIDPLALAQLVELVPREYLVTTTVRLVNACDRSASLRQSQALPDVSHVILQAIAEGRSDAMASLVLSPSGSYLRALENREHMTIIFYAALITGQIEVLRRLISVGFYDINVLVVWLFLNPNISDPCYVNYMKQTGSNISRFIEDEARIEHENGISDIHRALLDDGFVVEIPHKTLDNMEAGLKATSLTSGLCETLGRFLHDRELYKLKVSASSGAIPKTSELEFTTMEVSGQPVEAAPGVTCTAPNVGGQTSTRRTQLSGSSSDFSFSSLLSRKKLDRLLLSPIKCLVLPVVGTSVVRRVDPFGYTPLEGSTLHFLLVGDVSTANAHIVRLPPHYSTSWDENESMKAEHSRRRGKNHKTSTNTTSLSFYYEAHISLNFILDDVPISETPFSTSSVSSDESEEKPVALQKSNVCVGWCTESCVEAADGRSLRQPLGSDCNSFGISFDVLHRWRKASTTEEIILRPMKHSMGRATPFTVVNEVSRQQRTHAKGVEEGISLIRVLVEDAGLENDANTNDSFVNNMYSSPIQRPRYANRSPPPFPTEDSESHTISDAVPEIVVPTVVVLQPPVEGKYEEVGEENDEKTEEVTDGFDERTAPLFTNYVAVIRGISVYKSLALVVGCHVNLGTCCASFTLNGASLGAVFNTLPPALSLRPAVSLQASDTITSRMQGEYSGDAVAVRFVFARKLLLVTHIMAQERVTPSGAFSVDVSSLKSPNKGNEESHASIPGALPLTDPLLFDESMMNCALLRLITRDEDSLSIGENDDEELLRGDKETLSLGASARVTSNSVCLMLNALSSGESMLFFPPVLLKRRSDDSEKEANGVTIIPEDAALVPLCIALALRQRVPAYRIAVHPLTDFSTMNDVNLRQRRMAVLAAATLGYGEILHVLLERISIYEFLELFTIKTLDSWKSTLLGTDSSRMTAPDRSGRVTSATLLHRVEYTPLHCAILEGHQDCVHLILYYLNETISEEYRRHALNVLTRSGETALLMTCRLGYTNIAKRLLSMGASPSSFDRVTRANCLELACASCSEEIAMMLLQTPDYHSYVAVNQAGVAPPLCWCALHNIGSLIRPLLENGANPNITLDGRTPLLLAVSFGSQEAALELLHCCSAAPNASALEASDRVSYSQLCLSRSVKTDSVFGAKDTALAILDVDALDPRTQCAALHLACEQGQLEVVRSLISKGASLNLQSKSTYANPLQVAIMNGHETVALDILEYAKDKLRRGSNVLDIASIEKNGDTALHLAAREGLLQVIEYIMSQFSDEEVTRLCALRTFAKRPNAMSPIATNRQGRTPLLVAIYAHQEAAAQLIASLMPEGVLNPGGPAIDGTSLAIISSDAEGLDNVTLFFLSQKGYIANEAFREGFFARYNAKRLQMDLSEDAALSPYEDKSNEGFPRDVNSIILVSGREGDARTPYSRESQTPLPRMQRRGTNVTAMFLASARASVMGASKKLGVGKAKRSMLLSWRRSPIKDRSAQAESQRRRTTFVEMLLAKRATAPSVRKSILLLEQGFPLEELYIMADIISSETSRVSQSIRAMQYMEIITNFLREHGGVRVPSNDAVIFARKLLTLPSLVKAVETVGVDEARRRLLEIRPFCQEMINLIRTCGQHDNCVDEMRHLLAQRGTTLGSSFTDDVTSTFGFTVLQLAAGLGLAPVCDFFLGECAMDPLYVPQTDAAIHSSAKWLATPFRLALRSVSVETVSVFLSLATPPNGLQKLLEHRELSNADAQQHTAVQEIITQPLDTLPSGMAIDTLHLLRLLLAHGAIVQGNFDADGNDAWMLAVRVTPGKGTMLQLFLDEDVGLDNEESFDTEKRESREKSLNESAMGQTSKDVTGTGKPGDKYGSEGALSESQHASNDSSVSSLDFSSSNHYANQSLRLPSVGLDGSHTMHQIRRKQKVGSTTYCAHLLFLCAEYNPQCLVSLLEHHSHVLLPSLFHPITGDTLLVFLLRRAVGIYASECGTDSLLSSQLSHEDALQSTRRLFVHTGLKDTMTEKTTPYRDPLTIPSVYRLLVVVENLLRRFTFTNLYHEQEDGQTALALAARMSSTTLVGLIVRAESKRSTANTVELTSTSDLATTITRPSITNASWDTGFVNDKLKGNLEASFSWMMLATRLYYAEEDMRTVLTIANNLADDETKFSFLSLVYSNLHPIVAIRIAALYATHVKRFLMRPEAVNAFWCNVLYAQHAGRLEETNVTSSQWSSILTVLLPTAPSIPIYLIKALLSLTSDTISNGETVFSVLGADISGVSAFTQKGKGTGGRETSSWKFIAKRTDQYVKQLSAAAVSLATPASVLASIQSGGGLYLTPAQRNILVPMAAHFHEIIELSVRFDNPTLMLHLVGLAPEELHSCLKYEWRVLIETHHFDLVAIAAGSVNVLRYFSENPETARYMFINRYDRINPNTGIPDDLNAQAHFTDEPYRPVARGSVSIVALLKKGASEAAGAAGHVASRRHLDRQSVVSIENKPTSTGKRNKEVKLMAVSLLGFDAQNGTSANTNPDGTCNDDGTGEAGMQYMEMLTAARERETASAVTWGIGAATRPVSLRESVKTVESIPSPTRQSVLTVAHKKGKGGTSIAGDSPRKARNSSMAFPASQNSPRRETMRTAPFTQERKSILPASSLLEPTRGRYESIRRSTAVVVPQEQPRYFPYYLCDWALHTTLLLHAPKPSAKTIDVLLSLLDQRPPLTPSAVQIFLAASRPVNDWRSSEGELITLSYTTRAHKDTILHLLVQNNQVQLARYFLAAALCYFTCYQYDPLVTQMPPEFPSIDFPKTETQEKMTKTNATAATDDTNMMGDEEPSHPAVFLRSMLRMNKYGLTPFDYARGQMISVLAEYGCVPPSYRPNPRGFSRAIRLTVSHSLFYSVPRVLLVSEVFTRLHDEGMSKHSKRVVESKIKDIPDATIIRNQASSQSNTRMNVLPTILTDNVSLLHLGLCSADDELVVQSINEKRQKQVKRIVSPYKESITLTSPMYTSLPPTSRSSGYGVRGELSLSFGAKNMTNTNYSHASNSMAFAGTKVDKDFPSALKLLDVLRERGFVTFPLLLPVTDEFGQPINDAAHPSDTAILLTMTPMTLAQHYGVVKGEVGSPTPPSTTDRQTRKKKGNDSKSTGTRSTAILPRFTPEIGTANGRHPADVLDTWVTTRQGKTKGATKDLHQHPLAHILIRALGTGVAGRTIRLLGLSTAPSYEPR